MKVNDFKYGDIIEYIDNNISYLEKQYGIVSGVTSTKIYVISDIGKEIAFDRTADVKHTKLPSPVEKAFMYMLEEAISLRIAEEKLEKAQSEYNFLVERMTETRTLLESLLHPPEPIRYLKENEVPF
jgi:hypothetical protein